MITGVRRVLAAGIAFALAAAAPAAADETITATSPDRYTAAVTTIDQGEKVTLRNIDVAGHDVTSRARGADGKPLFSSDLVAPGRSGPVLGTEYLTTGTYDFLCSVHPGMEAKLEVTSAGQPVERPADRTRPKVTVKVLSKDVGKVAESGKLILKVGADEAADVDLVARAKPGKRKFKLGTATVSIARPGSRRVTIELSDSARKALRGADSAKVTVAASARDSAGNPATARASRTLR
jgi:plastocyanin